MLRRGLLLVLAAACLVGPGEAAGYALIGEGRLVKVDTVLVWDDGRQVLALLPHVEEVGEDAFLIVPVPAGAEPVLAPDADMFSPVPSSARERREGKAGESPKELESPGREQGDEEGSGSRGRFRPREERPGVSRDAFRHALRGKVERRREEPTSASEQKTRRARLGDLDERTGRVRPRESRRGPARPVVPHRKLGDRLDRKKVIAALRRLEPPLVRPAEPPVVLSADELRETLEGSFEHGTSGLFPSDVFDQYADEEWSFALVKLSATDERVRFGPVAFAMGATYPTVPIRLARALDPHRLSIRLIAAATTVDVAPRDHPLGLRHTQRPTPLDDALQAWMRAIGFEAGREWRVRGFATGPLNTEGHRLSTFDGELVLPVPRGARLAAKSEQEESPDDDDEEAEPAQSCGCRAAEGRGGAGAALVLLVVVLLLVSRFGGRDARGRFRVILAPSLACLLFVPSLSLASTSDEGDHLEREEEELPARADARHGRRVLEYPDATEEGSEAPVLRVSTPGSPLAVFFPDHRLDPRPEVHFVDEPERVGLRVAERTAFIEPGGEARPGDEALVTLTLSDGKPLCFSVLIVGPKEPRDATVEVRTVTDRRDSCVAKLAHLRDALAECKESSGERAVALIAGLLVEATDEGRAVEHRRVRFRDKQNRLFVEVVDAVRLYDHTFVRLRVENRDGSRRTWSAGEPTLMAVGPGPRRTPLEVISIFERPAIETGESTLVVLGLKTPQLPTGATLRLALHEADGQRHVVIEPLRI